LGNGYSAELSGGALLLREIVCDVVLRSSVRHSLAPDRERRACQDRRRSHAAAQVPSDKVLCSAKGTIGAPARGARECGVSQRTAAIYSAPAPTPPRRRQSGSRSLVGPIRA